MAISLAGVLVLVLVSFLLGGLKSAAVTREAAAERLAFDEPDFRAAEWMVGADGKAAATVSIDGAEAALIFAIGDGLASRRFRRGGVALRRDGSTLLIDTREPSLWGLKLKAPDEASAAEWLLHLQRAPL